MTAEADKLAIPCLVARKVGKKEIDSVSIRRHDGGSG